MTSAPTHIEVNNFVFAVRNHDETCILEFLGKYPSAVDITLNNGVTALIYSALTGDKKSVAFFLSRGANVNMVDGDGYTALHYAAVWLRADIARILLEHGAVCDTKNTYGDTPLMLAQKVGADDICEMIKEWSVQQEQTRAEAERKKAQKEEAARMLAQATEQIQKVRAIKARVAFKRNSYT